jgi:hypothetical protein
MTNDVAINFDFPGSLEFEPERYVSGWALQEVIAMAVLAGVI